MSAVSRRKKFVANKVPLSDEEFLTRLAPSPPLQKYLLMIRRIVARLCHVGEEMVHDNDCPKSIAQIMELDIAGGWDPVLFAMELEEELGVEIPPESQIPSLVGKRFFVWIELPPESFGAWALSLSKVLYDLERN